MDFWFKRGQTSVILDVTVLDTSGSPSFSIDDTFAGLAVRVVADNGDVIATYSGANLQSIATPGTYAAPTAGKVRVGRKSGWGGVVEFQFEDSIFATANAKYLYVIVTDGGSAIKDNYYTVALTDVNPYDAVRFGLTALPNTAVTTNASLLTSGTGTDQISVTAGRVDVGKVAGTSQTARDLGASVLLSVGTGTGQVNLASGKVPATLAAADVAGNVAADVQTVKTQAVTCAAGVTVLASVGTAATSTAQTGDCYTRIGAAGAGLTALGDARLAHLDADVSTRGTSTLTQTQVTGGAYSIQSASCVLGDARIAHLDADVSTRSTYAGGAVASVTGSVGAVASGGIVAASFAAGAVSAAAVSAAAANKLADHGRRRTQAAVFASADGDTPDKHSLYGFLQAAQNFTVSGTTLTVKNTDGTTLGTFTLVAAPGADPIGAIS